jgi:hypothetical protein
MSPKVKLKGVYLGNTSLSEGVTIQNIYTKLKIKMNYCDIY